MQQRYTLPSPTCDKVMNATASLWLHHFIRRDILGPVLKLLAVRMLIIGSLSP